ncbi:MAG: hypothetical protein AAGJ35_14395, partial [Myxococcota bacterium]
MKTYMPALVVLGLFFVSPAVFADFRAKRFDPNADAVKKRLFTKKSKQELNLSLGLVTNDPFYQNYNINLG